MKAIANVLTGFVALSHAGFMVFEMFLWDPKGCENFDLDPAVCPATVPLAQNMGLYNGFLAAGLLWALRTGRRDVKIFFLLCVVVAGVFGAITTKKKSLLFTQALPALAALLCVMKTSEKEA